MEDLFFWLAVAFLFLILEMANPGLFFFLSFFFGSLAAAISAVWLDSVMLQSLVFLAGTGVALAVLKLWLKKGGQKPHYHKTNAEALFGKRGIVIKAVTPTHPGQVTIGGEIWSAKSKNNATINVGASIEVVHVGGSHVVVKETSSF